MKFLYVVLCLLTCSVQDTLCMKRGVGDGDDLSPKRVRLDDENMPAAEQDTHAVAAGESEQEDQEESAEQQPLSPADRCLFDELERSVSGLAVRARQALLMGANVNARDPENAGNTPLHEAISLNLSDDIQRFLIANNADVNAVNNFGVSPLMLAADEAQFDSMTRLIRSGADFNAIDPNDGTTILHKIAGVEDSLGMVRALVRQLRMDYMATDDRGYIAADYARSAGQVPSLKFLVRTQYAKRWRDVIHARKVRSIAIPFLVGEHILPPVLSSVVAAYLTN